MSLSCIEPVSWFWTKKDLEYEGHTAVTDALESFLDSLFDEASARERREKRQREKAQAEEEREIEQDELALQFALWQSACEDDIRRKKVLSTFPHLPVSVLFCTDPSCKSFKEEPGSFRACQHDVERFLRASGEYGYAWLKKQRLIWHPDRFGNRCDPDHREELKKKAEQLFQILGTLMEQESSS